MTEPTLGRRIMDAAEAYANAVQEAIQTWGAGEWTGHHDEATAEELATLRALAARADAAERGMVALAAERAALVSPTPYHGRGWAEAGEYTKARDKTDNALAAWRALGEVDG